MSKPRIIIADTDIDYIIPLQLKFAKDFFDLIDIEIVSNEEYFADLFMKPQKADILIISEDLYDSSIQRHNISNIFLMTEQYEEEETGDLNIVRLFKYTSIKEIFNEIVGKSTDNLNIEKQQKQETQIIMVTSAAGGVGKTTIAMGLAVNLAINYKRTLYVNASRLQTFQWLLNNKTAVTEQEVYKTLLGSDKETYEEIKHTFRKEIFDYLPPFKASLVSLGLNYSVFQNIIESAKKSNDYDFIIVDAENTFDEENLKLIDISNRILVITEQTNSSVEATNKFVSNINFTNSEKYTFVCNKFSKDAENILIVPDKILKFSVNEYIDELLECERNDLDIIAKNAGIKKIAYAVL